MRIGFLAQPFDKMYPPVQGGSLAIWIYQIARVVARRGVGVVNFGNHGGTWASRATTHEGMDHVFTPTGFNRAINRLAPLRPDRRSIPAFASSWHDYGYAREVGIRCRRLDCDVVHVMNYSQFVPVVRKFHPRAKICLHMQCEWLTQVDRDCIARRLAQADLVVGCSEYITGKISDAYPEFADRCVTVPNAAAVPPDPKADGEERSQDVLFVGRVSPEKGIHDLITAFHGVLKRFPEARLRIVGGFGSAPLDYLVGLSSDPRVSALRRFYEPVNGSGKDPYLAHLEAMAGDELGHRVRFEGRVDYSQTTAFYRQAAVLVNPSLSESFGMSLVEAMMHRVPTVATRIGGMPFIVDPDRTGRIVDPASPAQLCESICDLLENPEEARRMGDAGRARALEKFTWENAADLLLEHYRRL